MPAHCAVPMCRAMGSVVPQGGACQRTHPHIRHTHCPRCRHKSQPKTPPYKTTLQAAHRKAASGKSSETINKHGWELGGGRWERAICVVDKRRLPPSNYRTHNSTLLHIAVDICHQTSTHFGRSLFTLSHLSRLSSTHPIKRNNIRMRHLH